MVWVGNTKRTITISLGNDGDGGENPGGRKATATVELHFNCASSLLQLHAHLRGKKKRKKTGKFPEG
ncbi:hypothetical protein I7I50_09705 [Histoplasma capsulatum G186AR]|uniref:Uncharacterized protein n=1 Tax=Ajellomyces capsulatus TaxID=5037 RepID=A0A8H7YRP4_AJECA|nr:hypothetical protein I7I52_07236 [Histoplasma capsulatum]QSS74495.1 hypothetical protein I7I50_09705 [Histoplasma capsulatum G186AR]